MSKRGLLASVETSSKSNEHLIELLKEAGTVKVEFYAKMLSIILSSFLLS